MVSDGQQYSYLASVPLLVIYSIATTVIKFKEGATLALCAHLLV